MKGGIFFVTKVLPFYILFFFVAPALAAYKMPFPRGQTWGVTQGWEENCSDPCIVTCNDSDATHYTLPGLEYAIDFNLSQDQGKPVVSAAAGKIVYVENNVSCTNCCTGWGNVVIIDHGDDTYSKYAHLEHQSVRVTKGQWVPQGYYIGRVGSTGCSTGPHLHFQIQNSSGPNGQSIRLSFDDAGIPRCGQTYTSQNIDTPIIGDWDGNNVDTTGSYYQLNTSRFTLDSGKNIGFGQLGDIPIVGDWDGDGYDEIGLFRPNEDNRNQSTFYLDLDNNGGQADKTIPFGYYPQDIPIAGDWDGSGDDDIGGFNPTNNTFYLYILNLNSSSASFYKSVQLGISGDYPIVGDWNGDGKDEIGIFRVKSPNQNTNNFYFDIGLTGGQAEYSLADFGLNGYGNIGDIPIIGDWDGDGDDNIGIYRSSTEQFFTNSNVPNIAISQTTTTIAPPQTTSTTTTPLPTTTTTTTIPITAKVFVDPPTIKVSQHSLFSLHIKIDSSGLKIGSYQFTISFNPSVIQINEAVGNRGVEAGSDFPSPAAVSLGDGVLTFNGLDVAGKGPSSNLDIAIINFIARGSVGDSTTINLTIDSLTDERGSTISASASNGFVEIIISTCPGDVNRDRRVSIADALLVARHSAGLQADIDSGAADTNQDGRISIADALLIARMSAGLIPIPPCQ